MCWLNMRADVLLHDAQYTEAEYPSRIGWGHSAVDQVVAFGSAAKVGKLLLFHHDPLHTDADLDAQLARAKELTDGQFDVDAAREGETIDL